MKNGGKSLRYVFTVEEKVACVFPSLKLNSKRVERFPCLLTEEVEGEQVDSMATPRRVDS